MLCRQGPTRSRSCPRTTAKEAAPEGKVALPSLAFKPDIDGFRESPALEIAEALARSHGEHILLVERVAEVLPAAFDGTGAKLVPLDSALREAEVVVVLVGKLVYDAQGVLSK